MNANFVRISRYLTEQDRRITSCKVRFCDCYIFCASHCLMKKHLQKNIVPCWNFKKISFNFTLLLQNVKWETWNHSCTDNPSNHCSCVTFLPELSRTWISRGPQKTPTIVQVSSWASYSRPFLQVTYLQPLVPMTDSGGYSEWGGKQRTSQTLLPSNPPLVGVNKDEWQPIRDDSSPARSLTHSVPTVAPEFTGTSKCVPHWRRHTRLIRA